VVAVRVALAEPGYFREEEFLYPPMGTEQLSISLVARQSTNFFHIFSVSAFTNFLARKNLNK
jgi:hypothetical protein